MTTDRIQNKYERTMRARRVPVGSKLELTRESSFVDGHQDMFDVLAKRNTGAHAPANLLQNNLDETVRYLKRSRDMLKNANETIKDQDARINALESANLIDLDTGLLNKSSFATALSREIARTNRGYSQGGLLVMFSVENFSALVDLYGEDAGVSASKLVAQTLEKEIRDMDLAARVSDDEFILLFADTSMKKALNRLQNMAMRLNRLSLELDGKDIRLSLSLGLKSYEHGAEAAHIFDAANTDLKRNSAQSRAQDTRKTRH